MRIVTHSGKFHADDVLAWSLLCHFHPEGHLFTIKRTRDEELFKKSILSLMWRDIQPSPRTI